MSNKKFKTHKRGKPDEQALKTVREFFDKEKHKEELRKEFVREKRKNPALDFKEWFKNKTSELKKEAPEKEDVPDFVKEFVKNKRKESKDVRDMTDAEYEKHMETYGFD